MGNRPVPARSVRGPAVTVRHVTLAVHAPDRAGLAPGSFCCGEGHQGLLGTGRRVVRPDPTWKGGAEVASGSSSRPSL